MSIEYKYEGLSAAPSMGMLQDAVANSMAQTSWADISYHPEERWLKIWFAEALSEADQTKLQGFVADSLGVKKFTSHRGSVFFELAMANNRRWQKHRRRIAFPSDMPSVPNIEITNATFDGSANVEMLAITESFFDFRVTAVNGSGKLKGLTSVEFDWEAKAWEA